MGHSTISTCHSLRIIPLARVSRFARYMSRVSMKLSGVAFDAGEVPGSVRISTTTNNGNIREKITFERSDVSATTANLLERLKVSRLIATYVDESGQRRVAGSPDWPLTLDYSTDGGVFVISLEGTDTEPDGFLRD